MPDFQITEKQRFAVANILRMRFLDTANAVHAVAKPHTAGIYEKYVKRAVDIAVSGAALAITLPINAAIALGTFLDVGSPIFFKQERVGKDGKIFILYKFRNMTNETDENGDLLPAEQRVTKFGRIMRSTSLDELLNFWCIFKGEMSIIGPRPLLPEYTDRYCEYHKSRLAVKPGLECPPNPGLDDASTWEGQFNNDAWYAENISALTDIKKFIRLVEAVFNKRKAKTRGSAGRSFFVGYNEQGIAISLDEVSDDIASDICSAS